jgi:hypothetical protein
MVVDLRSGLECGRDGGAGVRNPQGIHRRARHDRDSAVASSGCMSASRGGDFVDRRLKRGLVGLGGVGFWIRRFEGLKSVF